MYLNNNKVHIDTAGVVSGGYVGFAARLTGPDTTITTDADTWYRLNGTFDPEFNYRFGFVGDTLVYLGGTDLFMLIGSGEVSSTVNFTRISVGVGINGADPICCAQQSIKINTKDTFQSNSLIVRFELGYGDRLIAMVKSDKAGAGIAGNSFNYNITRIFR